MTHILIKKKLANENQSMHNGFSFPIGLTLSITLHVIIYFTLNHFMRSTEFENQAPPTTEKKIKVTLVEEGQRVDIIGMPTHTVQELKELEKIRVANTRVERKREVFFNMLKNIAKNESTYVPSGNRPVGEPKVLLLAGNKISKGMALVAGKRDPDLGGFHQYLESLPPHIKPFWKLPSYLLGKDLRCRIQIVLSEEGRLLSHTIIESSGDEEFDRRAIEATLDSAPFPKPDESIVPYLRQGHIILGFPQ
ncbi:MAG: TonB family protein [Deltaproteobacteria bacterium]|nr:MAG: TonB family protein [Deltaproteobacteria bacterium]